MTGPRSSWLLGGLFIGVLSSLPIVSMGNLCCCLWVVLGGVLTMYLQFQDERRVIESGDAVLAGGMGQRDHGGHAQTQPGGRLGHQDPRVP